MGTVNAHVRARLRAHLEAMPARPTQSSIGRAIDRTQTWVSHYFSGRHNIDIDTLAKLCDFLQVSLTAVLASDDDAHTLTQPYAEAVTLMQAVAPDERELILDMLRALVRRPVSARKRARR